MTELARPLETGWLPDTPVGDSLLRRFTANQADLQDHLVGAVGGRSDRTPGVALSDSGVASAYLNQECWTEHSSCGMAPDVLPVDDLLAQDVCVPAVLG
jgi:hypothetical protein